jgi:peroxiredoxin Q/BCP
MVNSLEINQTAPNFSAPNANGETITLADFTGQWLVLYFYPKDNTPGCTTEAIDFTQRLPTFKELNAQIVGVSPDSEVSHCKFIEKHKLAIQLISDPNHQVAEAYGAWGLKKFMGKEYEGIIRSTFLINPEGNIAHIWSNVRVKDHVDKVLTKLKSLI